MDWDTTQNLMIEGDNLEVLKLLQKSYAGKVKLIYIDPPYNTGKDFVYPDNFQDSIKNYLELTGQVEGGAKISSNTEASGRFHTDWLNMMYPRLRLARTLLRHDGVDLRAGSMTTKSHNLRCVLRRGLRRGELRCDVSSGRSGYDASRMTERLSVHSRVHSRRIASKRDSVSPISETSDSRSRSCC